jgi:hypothetical protein
MPQTKVSAAVSMEKLDDRCDQGDYKQKDGFKVNGDITEAPVRYVTQNIKMCLPQP